MIRCKCCPFYDHCSKNCMPDKRKKKKGETIYDNSELFGDFFFGNWTIKSWYYHNCLVLLPMSESVTRMKKKKWLLLRESKFRSMHRDNQSFFIHGIALALHSALSAFIFSLLPIVYWFNWYIYSFFLLSRGLAGFICTHRNMSSTRMTEKMYILHIAVDVSNIPGLLSVRKEIHFYLFWFPLLTSIASILYKYMYYIILFILFWYLS